MVRLRKLAIDGEKTPQGTTKGRPAPGRALV